MALLAAVLCAVAALSAERDHGRLNRLPATGGRRPSGSPLESLGRLVLRARPALAGRIPAAPAISVTRAGLGGSFDPQRVRTLRAGSVTCFGGAGLAALLLVPSPFVALAALGMAGFGWRYPDVWLAARGRRRGDRLERRAPALLELVAATVAAGVPIDAALAGCAAAIGGPLAEEVELTLGNLALGRPRAEELLDLAERSGAPSVAALALALRLSDRLGVPLSDTLRDQAARTRAMRARAVQERAAKAGPKVLAVVVFVLVPASLLPVLTAVALTAAGATGSFGL